MPEKIQIVICVAALTHGQHEAVMPADLKKSLVEAVATYDVVHKGRVYDDHPDQWSPFKDEKEITEYLHEEGFDVNSLSHYLSSSEDASKVNSLLTEVDLYLFDPLFLAVGGREILIAKLEGAICHGNRYFALMIPRRLPPDMRDRLLEIAEQKLPQLSHAYTKGLLSEWETRREAQLKHLLNMIRKDIRGLPTRGRLNTTVALLESWGVQALQMDQSPRQLNR